ncbi:MAG: TIGR00730 family Rossman fold protein [Candidatus Rokubacteria bacterium]|nr:TIGR00730 family Rossman fold protein [Candidatus Rokubacteria bacterium]
MNRICVFAGSAAGNRSEYAEAARQLAGELVRRRLGLVYGGGSVGLMGVLADAVLGAGGEVIGVIPRGLASRELAHAGLTELRIVESMHERKATMASLADAFVALPGGLGTLEETLEILTWAQLGIHVKPVGVVNAEGYYDPFIKLLANGVREGFIHRQYVALLLFADTPAALLDLCEGWRPPAVRRAWLDRTQV